MKKQNGKKMPQMRRDNSVLGRAVGYLRSLGRTSSQIAATLSEKGVKGHRHSSIGCPLGRALTQKFGRAIQVGRRLTWVDAKGRSKTRKAPMPCQRFVKEFDEGVYPGLEEK